MWYNIWMFNASLHYSSFWTYIYVTSTIYQFHVSIEKTIVLYQRRVLLANNNGRNWTVRQIPLSHGHTGLYDAIRRLTMGKFRWSRTIGGKSCVIVRRRTTSQPSGVIARCRGSVCDVQKPGWNSKHRRVSWDLARSYEVTRRCTTSPHNIN